MNIDGLRSVRGKPEMDSKVDEKIICWLKINSIVGRRIALFGHQFISPQNKNRLGLQPVF